MTEPSHSIDPPPGAPIFDHADQMLDGTRITQPQQPRTWRDTWQQFRQGWGRLAQFDTLLLALLVWAVRMAGYGAAFVVVAIALVVAVGVYGKLQPEEAWLVGASGQRGHVERFTQRVQEVVIVVRMITLYWLELVILGTLAYVTIAPANAAVLVGVLALGIWWLAWWLIMRSPRGLSNTMRGRNFGRRHVRKTCAIGFRSGATICAPLRTRVSATGWDVYAVEPNAKSAEGFFNWSTRYGGGRKLDLASGMRALRVVVEPADRPGRANFYYQLHNPLTVPARPAPVFGGG